MSEPLTENELDRLLHAPSVDEFLDQQETTERSLADYLSELLAAKRLERAQVVRMANLNETFGYHSAKEWFGYLKEWKKQLESDVTITCR